MEQLAHSVLGPSSAERWLNCSASVLATKDLPDEGSRYSAEGTAAHTLSEWCRQQNKRAKEFIGAVIPSGAYSFTVDEEMADAVQEFVDRCAETEGDAVYEARVYYEQWVPGGFGTADDIRIREGFCKIVDLKYGTGVQVYAKRNPQLMLYALGVYATYGWLYSFDKFVLGICQPRLGHYDEDEISLAELLEWADKVIRPGAVKALDGTGVFCAGNWCSKTFCKIRGTCRVRAEHVFETVTGVFSDLDAAAVAVPEAKNRIATLSNDEIAKALSVLPGIIAWGLELKGHAAAEIAAGRPVGDFKFVDGRSSRDFIVSEKEIVETAEKLFVDKSELYTTPELKSVAKIEKIVGPKHFAEEKRNEDGSVKKEAGVFAKLIRKSKGKPTLVPGSDKRPAVSVDPTDVFKDLGGEDE